MRSPLWFVVAGVIAIAGFVASGLYLWPRLGSADAGLIRIVVPGISTLDLAKSGTYTIFHEKHSVVDGRFYASDSVPDLRVGVVTEGTDAQVRLESASGTSYSIGSRKGESLLAFTINRPGRYRLTTSMTGGPGVLAIGQGLVGSIFALVGGTIAIAGIILVLTIWQRWKT